MNRCKTMKKLLVLSVLGIALGMHPESTLARQSLTIASIPWQTEEKLRQIYAPLLELVDRENDVSSQLVITKDYAEILEMLQKKVADLAILGGNSYVEAKAAFPELHYLATCKQPTAYYYSLIIAHKDSRIRELKDLAGQRFGYTDVHSTSGFLYPNLMLTQASLDPKSLFGSVIFLNKHDKVYNAVAKKVIDAGGASITPFQNAVENNGDVFRIVAQSDPIPRNAVVAGPHVSKEVIAQLRKTFANAELDEQFISSSNVLKGFLIKDDSFYNIIREAKVLP